MKQQFLKLPVCQSLITCGKAVVIAGIGILGLAALTSQPKVVRAIEAGNSQVAAVSSWRAASFPVENFLGYTSPFGYRQSPYGSGTRFHYGLDIAAPDGSYVRNWWAGQIVEVSDDSTCGTSVIVQSGSWTHIYCHMHGYVEFIGGQRYLVDRSGGIRLREGQQIPSGARIGRVGLTGRTTGPHLHWGMKYSGSWVDPAVVLRAMYSQQTARR
ncbi:MAG: M23 family metallopeptidase [Cyanothece sp. SIO1E1]|nr:M23 family metallopeptidase [Cyanothece sp. SIO1E1]